MIDSVKKRKTLQRRQRLREEQKAVQYPFKRWLSKATTVLVKGIDYDIRSEMMAQIIRNKANEMELTVSFKLDPLGKKAISLTVWNHVKRGE